MNIRGIVKRSSKNLRKSLDRASSPTRRIWPRFHEAMIGTFALLVVGISLTTDSRQVAKYASRLGSGNKYIALIDQLLRSLK